LKRKPQAAPIASQIKKNRTMKMTLRRLLLAISLYTRRILWHRRYPDSVVFHHRLPKNTDADEPDTAVGCPADGV
jgi:hypothetical protein